MRFKAWLAILIVMLAVSACADAPPERQTTSELWYSNIVEVPVHVILFYNGTNANGEPRTLGSDNVSTTVSTVDADLAVVNTALLEAATALGGPGVPRQVRVRRVSSTLVSMPNVTIDDPAQAAPVPPRPLVTITNYAQYFRPGMMNLIVCNHNAGTSSSYADNTENAAHVRYGGGFHHEVVHLLELRHIFLSANGTDEGPQYREPLARDYNANNSSSCYRTGDRVCDTYPDNGWAIGTSMGSGVYVVPSPIQCSRNSFLPCVQTSNIACTTAENTLRTFRSVGPGNTDPLPSQNVYCEPTSVPGEYRRIYDPTIPLFNYVTYQTNPVPPAPPPPGNLMSYNYMNFMTAEQFLRSWGYSRWALNEPYGVSESDKDKLWDFTGHPGRFGGGAIPSRRRHRVTRVEVPLTLSLSGSLASSQVYVSPTVPLTRNGRGDGRALLGVELVATKTGGTLPSNSNAQIQTPRPGVVQSLRLVEDGSLIRSVYQGFYNIGDAGRGSLGSALGNWYATIWMGSGSGVSYSDLRINLYLADRGNVTNSFFNRGISDVLVYRPSSRQLWVSFGDTSPGVFGYGQSASLPWSSTADCDAFLVAGNFDSDNTLDVICNAPNTSNIQPSGLFTGWQSLQADSVVTGIGSITRSQSNTMIAGDFDSDFLDDLLLGPGTNISSGGWAVYRNEGNRAFSNSYSVAFNGQSAPLRPNGTAFSSSTTWTVGDFDGDGLADLMVREASGSYGVMYFYRSLGLTSASSYGFAAPQQITVGGGSTAFYFTDDDMTAFDATGDGADDLVFRRKSTGEWWISNSPGPRFSTASFSGGWRAQIGGQYSGNYLSTDRVIGSSR